MVWHHPEATAESGSVMLGNCVQSLDQPVCGYESKTVSWFYFPAKSVRHAHARTYSV